MLMWSYPFRTPFNYLFDSTGNNYFRKHSTSTVDIKNSTTGMEKEIKEKGKIVEMSHKILYEQAITKRKKKSK